MIDEFAQAFRALFVIIDSCVNELLQVLQTRFGFVGVFALERILVAGVEDGGFDEIGNEGVGDDDVAARTAKIDALPDGRASAWIGRGSFSPLRLRRGDGGEVGVAQPYPNPPH